MAFKSSLFRDTDTSWRPVPEGEYLHSFHATQSRPPPLWARQVHGVIASEEEKREKRLTEEEWEGTQPVVQSGCEEGVLTQVASCRPVALVGK